MHAPPALHGSRRRQADDPCWVRDFYTSESLREITQQLRVADRKGRQALDAADGTAVKEWSQRSSS